MQVAQELPLEPEFLWRILTGDVGGHVEADVLSPGQDPDLQKSRDDGKESLLSSPVH